MVVLWNSRRGLDIWGSEGISGVIYLCTGGSVWTGGLYVHVCLYGEGGKGWGMYIPSSLYRL